MDQYTWCPGECAGLVKIWPGDGINFCCEPCWKTHWAAMTAGLEGGSPYELDNYGHSPQCHSRQLARVPFLGGVITDREFTLMGKKKSPDDLRSS